MPFQCSWLGMVVSSEQTESSKQKAQLEAHTELPTHRVLMCGVSNMYYNAIVLICVCSKSVTVWITFQFVIAKNRQDAMVIGHGQQGCRWILATCPSTFRHSQYREPL